MDSAKKNAQAVWGAVKRHAKEHHESVNAAVEAYYPQPQPQAWLQVSKTVSSSRSSFESDRPQNVTFSNDWSTLETRPIWKRFSRSEKA